MLQLVALFFCSLFISGLYFRCNAHQYIFVFQNNADFSAPTPYQFSYSAPAVGGGSSHEETSDEYGRKQGSYTIEDEDGRRRVVQYVADENGFRASITTNEPGTSNQNPADVTISSSAGEGIQEFTAPAIAPVAPVAIIPARTSQPRPVFPRQQFRPQPFRRQTFQPVQPFQPTLIPFQPALFPFGNQQPAVIPIRQPSVFPINQPSLIPINQPSVYPINQPQLIPIQIDPGFQQPGNFFQFRPSYAEGGFVPIV
ncbi:hypothetical protein JTE90_001189 [Oedothorax gibbosus]|uniref:Cuticle protein n=1 Tax=Oedothorax gibbosus TaxID=931172 RepID=A0AAV6UTK1_9ARAC|nr:hypothetical protein JTE90_001189 [Oedothorax gibbosus]